MVSIVDFAFHPATLEVAAGTTVTWTNNDTVPHTVTALDGSFDSGNLSPGESWSYTFREPGDFAYQCLYHPQMQGTVTVS
jgi:plastocyanin